MTGIQAVTDSSRARPTAPEPWPCWKTSTTTPKRRGERHEVQQHGLEREHDRAEGADEQDQRQDQHQRHHVRQTAGQGMDEVAVDRGEARHGRAGPGERRVRTVDDRLDAGRGAVDRREGLDERVRPVPPDRARADHARHGAQPGRDALGVAPALDEDVDRLHHARGDVRGGELVAAGDGGAGAGEPAQRRLGGVKLRAEAREHRDDRHADRRDGRGAAHHEARPAAPRAVLGTARRPAGAASPAGGRCAGRPPRAGRAAA